MLRRLIPFAALAAVVLVPAAVAAPAASHTAHGTVVGKDRAHRGLVVALPGGTVQTFVAPSAFGRANIGRNVVVHYSPVAGKLPLALSVSLTGHASHALVRGTIVRIAAQRAIINAGGSALRVTLKAAKKQRALASAKDGPQVGDTVKVEVEINGDGSLDGSGVVVAAAPAGPQAGSDGEMEVRGKVKTSTPTSITITTGSGVDVPCTIPTGVTLNVQVGDLIELKCDLIGSTWTVRVAHGEQGQGSQGEGGQGDSKVEMRGTITSIDASQVTVTPTGGQPVTCAIPAGVKLAGTFNQNDVVKIECVKLGATLTLKSIEKKGASAQSSGGIGGSDDNGDDDNEGSDDSGPGSGSGSGSGGSGSTSGTGTFGGSGH